MVLKIALCRNLWICADAWEVRLSTTDRVKKTVAGLVNDLLDFLCLQYTSHLFWMSRAARSYLYSHSLRSFYSTNLDPITVINTRPLMSWAHLCLHSRALFKSTCCCYFWALIDLRMSHLTAWKTLSLWCSFSKCCFCLRQLYWRMVWFWTKSLLGSTWRLALSLFEQM